MKILSGLSLKEIEEITDSLGATKFRARQIHNWIYLKSVKEIDEMTDLSIKFREELKQDMTSEFRKSIDEDDGGSVIYDNFKYRI